MPSLREEITKTFLRWTTLPGFRRQGEPAAPPETREGQQLGAYRILKRLGFGGMGHVYLALDTRLGRHVALKFLSPELTTSHMLYRLQQEARTASALNHPNILTIYEIGELDGEYCIASEYVEGATLRTAIERGAVDIRTAIEIAGQIASALVAAHGAGVVHRDLKPGNIMIRSDGYVKVIDFGLAKHVSRAEPNSMPASALTHPGAVVGTVHYMSPEQARGDQVDHRTDLWSLGVILYEMITAQCPFDGLTDSHVIVAILDHPVPPLPAGKTLPTGLPVLIQRALAKDPEKRYQTAQEMLADLQQIGPTSGIGSKIRPLVIPERSRTRRKWLASTAVVFALLLVAAGIWWWGFGGKDRVLGPDWFTIDSIRQLTFNGRTILSCISPDGKYLAFVTGDPGGLQTLYLKQVNSGTEEVKIPPKRTNYVGITFSPDDQLFVVEKDEQLMGRLYALPLVGAASQSPLIVDIDGPVSFSPDGGRFAFVRYIHEQRDGRDQIESAIFTASRDGLHVQKLVSTRDSTILRQVAWSPKGNRIAAFLYHYLPDRTRQPLLELIDLQGNESRKPLPDWHLIARPWWASGGRSLIVSSATRTQATRQAQLREIATESDEIRDITKDLAGYESVSLTVDGLQLAAVKLESKATLWISAPNKWTTGQTVLAEADQRPSITWSGESHLVINSQRGGFPNLWTFDIESQTRTSLTNEPFVEQSAVSIPNNKSVAFVSNRSGQFKIWKFDPETNTLTQLTFGPSYEETPSVSPDGKWVVYTSWTSTSPHLYKVPVNGGESVEIGSFTAKGPQISPDGKWIACQMENPDTTKTVAIIPFDGSAPPRPVPNARLPLRWSPDGKNLTTVITDPRSVSNLWSIPLDGSAPRQLTHFDDQVILNFAWSPKGDRLACLRASTGTDVVLFRRQKR